MSEYEYKLLIDRLEGILQQVSKSDNSKIWFIIMGGVIGIIGTLVANYFNNRHQYKLKLHLDLANRFAVLETDSSFLISELNNALKAKRQFHALMQDISRSSMQKEEEDKLTDLAKENMYRLRSKIDERINAISIHLSYIKCFKPESDKIRSLFNEFWNSFNNVDQNQNDESISKKQIAEFENARNMLLTFINNEIIPKYPRSRI